MRFRRVLVVLMCLGLTCGAGEVAKAKQRKPTILLLHGGGFVSGDPHMPALAQTARREGFEPVSVDYALGNLRRARRDVGTVAKRYSRGGRSVVALGLSAGGTLAARAAQKGQVRAAFALNPIADLTRWDTPAGQKFLASLNAPRRQLRKTSPARFRSRRPILAHAAEGDTVNPPQGTLSWARRDPRVRARLWGGNHFSSTDPVAQGRQAYRFLRRQARR